MTTKIQNRLYLIGAVNAVLLVGLTLGSRSRASEPATQPAQPNTITVMPGQLSPNLYGVYVMDTARQTLDVYEYLPGEQELKLVAARDTQFDRRLRAYNTTPDPAEIQHQVERSEQAPRTHTPAGTEAPEK